MELKRSIGFEELFNKSVPHILERIFLSLDINSIQQCYKVCQQWKSFLTSEYFEMKVKSEFAWAIEDTFYNAAYCSDSLKVGTLLSYGLMDVNYVALSWASPGM